MKKMLMSGAVVTAVALAIAGTVSLLGDQPVHAADGELATLKARLDKLENEVGMQQDIEQVRRLQYAYNYYNSNGMSAQLLGTIADNAESIEIGGRGVFKGKEGFKRAFASYRGKPDPVDQVQKFGDVLFQIAAMDLITVAPDRKTAKARVRVVTPILRDWPNTRFQMNGGEYEMGYVKENGTWKISRFKYVHTFVARFNKDGTITPSYSTDPDKTAGPTTWYHPWPETGTLPYHFAHPVTGAPSPELTGTQRYWIGNWPGEYGQTGHR